MRGVGGGRWRTVECGGGGGPKAQGGGTMALAENGVAENGSEKDVVAGVAVGMVDTRGGGTAEVAQNGMAENGSEKGVVAGVAAGMVAAQSGGDWWQGLRWQGRWRRRRWWWWYICG